MRNNQLRVNLLLRSQSGAGWTCAMRAIKAKGARRNFRQADAAVHAGKFLREQNLFPINDGNQYHTIAQLQRRLQRIGNALPEIPVNLLTGSGVFSGAMNCAPTPSISSLSAF